MGTTAEKLTYLNDTKQLLKESINSLGGNLTTEPFRQYASVLEGIYESLPKISGIGANLSLSPSMVGKIKLNEIQGDTLQQTYSGKNLLKNFATNTSSNGIEYTIDNDGGIKANGTATATSFIVIQTQQQSPLFVPGNYTFSLLNTMPNKGNVRFEFYKEDKTTRINQLDTTSVLTTTLEENAYLRVSYIFYSGGTPSNFYNMIQMEKGSTATEIEKYVGGVSSPNPDYPQEIVSVTGLQNIDINGENLFTGSIVQGAIVADGTLENSSTSRIRFNDLIPIEAGTYKISYLPNSLQYYVHYYYPDKTHRTASGSWRDMGTFDVLEGGYIAIMFRKSDNSSITPSAISNIKIFDTNTSNTYEVNLGKNLFNKDNVNANKRVNSNDGTIGNMNGISCSDYIDINGAKSLYLSGNTTSQNLTSYQCAFYNSSKTFISGIATTINAVMNNRQIDVPNNAKYIIFNFVNADKNKMQIEKGSTSTSYSEYFTPIELNKIDTYEDSIKKSTGKNLFDKNAITNDKWLLTDGTEEVATQYCISDFIPVEENEQYYLPKTDTKRLKYYDGNKQPLTSDWDISSGASGQIINVPSNAKYVRFTIHYTVVDINTFMFNKGRTALPYEPYGKVWYIEKNINKKIFDGSNSDGTWAKQTGYYNCNANLGGITGQGYANYYSYGNLSNANRFMITTNAFRVNDLTDTLDNYKSWLSTHNIELYYVSNTPTYTEITNTTLIEQLETLSKAKSKNGTTNINVTSEDLSMLLNVGVLKGDVE